MTSHNRFARYPRLTGLLICVWLASYQQAIPQQRRNFTVADEIGLATFNVSSSTPAISISPNGALVAVQTERGLLVENRVQDEVRVYSLDALRRFVNTVDQSKAPEPLWTISNITYKEGPIISDLRWLADSRSFIFVAKTEAGRDQLWLADIQHRTRNPLTSPDQDVTGFDVNDATHFVYTVRTPGPSAEMMKPGKVSAFNATGLSLYSPLMRSVDDPETYSSWDRSELWAMRGGKPFPVRNSVTGHTIVLYPVGQRSMSLSPSGNSVAIALPLDDVPKDWETRYRPERGNESYRLTAGHQDLNAALGGLYASSYATIDLRNNKISVLADAPTAISVAWGTLLRIAWSEDSSSLVLPGTFLPDRADIAPCVALAQPSKKTVECLAPVPASREEVVRKAGFVLGHSNIVVLESEIRDSSRTKTANRIRTFSRTTQGQWEAREQTIAGPSTTPTTEVAVKQSLNEPPMLVMTDRSTQKSRVVWDPNPQLKQIALGEASAYQWKDKSGKQWTGGLYKPDDYKPGKRYPLVVQTHGFVGTQFNPSGVYPSGFAARALAAAGIIVLQVPDCSNSYTGDPDEAPCHLRGYESGVRQLVAEGVVDPARVGIIGFSRTCFYVMQALTASNMRLKAASIVDGVNEGYLQYLLMQDAFQGAYQRDSNSIMGSTPSGPGLQQWLQRSPEFNLDKVNAPLRVVARRGMNVLFMWEPYAMLRVLKKPVDLLVLNTSQHVLTNPGARLASQGGTVDWFRFWLKDEEDPDPSKAEQFKRWRELRKLQEANDQNLNKPTETKP